MPGPRLSVVVTRRLPEVVETRMAELFDVSLRDPDTPMTREEVAAALRTADVLVPCVSDHIDAALLGQAGPRLRLIANYGAGVDHIDVASARSRGILVSNTPDVLSEDTADMTIALILAVLRGLPEGMAEMQAGQCHSTCIPSCASPNPSMLPPAQKPAPSVLTDQAPFLTMEKVDLVWYEISRRECSRLLPPISSWF